MTDKLDRQYDAIIKLIDDAEIVSFLEKKAQALGLKTVWSEGDGDWSRYYMRSRHEGETLTLYFSDIPQEYPDNPDVLGLRYTWTVFTKRNGEVVRLRELIVDKVPGETGVRLVSDQTGAATGDYPDVITLRGVFSDDELQADDKLFGQQRVRILETAGSTERQPMLDLFGDDAPQPNR